MWRIVGLFVLGAGCAQGALAPDGGAPPPDGEPPPPDAQVDAAAPDAAVAPPGSFIDNAAADFAGGTLDEAVIEPWGAIAPAAYYTGGLRVRASDTQFFTDATTATWAQVEAMSMTGRVAPARTLWTSWGTGTPAGLGLTSGDNFTLAHDGHLYLEAGTWTFHLLADDHAFLELAPPGTASFSRVASTNWPTEGSGTFVAAQSAWHPIRLAYVERTGSAQLRVELSGPTIPTRAPLSRHRLRFLASGLVGLHVGGFDDAGLLGDHQAAFDVQAPAARNWGSGRPADLGLTSDDHFSVRWAGQLRIDVPGDYVLRYVSDDGQRLWIDGALLLDHWDDTFHDETTEPLALEPGWHDLVIDHTEFTGDAQAFVSIASGPELVGTSLPVDRLRPVIGRGERYDTGVDAASHAIPDNGHVEATIAIDAPPGAKVFGVDVGWTFEHTYHGDLQIRLIAPDGSVVLLRDNVGGGQSGTVTERQHTALLDGATASGAWKLRVSDTVSLDTGWLREFQLTVHHRSGQPPIAQAASFESDIKDLGPAVTAYQALTWGARLATGTVVRVLVRSGDTEEALAAEQWSLPIFDPGAGAPQIPARRYFQYRIELYSDGDGTAMVDWVRLDFATEELSP